jgi:transporter family-2 protein
MTKIIMVLLTVLVGCLVALQGAINAQLGKELTHPLQAAFISFLAGTLVLALALAFSKFGYPTAGQLTSVHPKLLIGGVFGAIFVTSTILFIPKIGVANVLIAAVTGQMFLSLILDHFGLFGLDKQPASLARISGVLLVIVGLALVTKG